MCSSIEITETDGHTRSDVGVAITVSAFLRGLFPWISIPAPSYFTRARRRVLISHGFM